MAGGATTVALLRAASSAGAFGFLPGGYQTPAALAESLAQLRSAGIRHGVNLFCAAPTAPDPDAYARYASELQAEADPYGIDLSAIPPTSDDDHWAAKLALLCTEPVPWVSFTFGLPTPGELAQLRAAGSRLAVTVTTVAEAEQASRAGIDLLIVQGPAAGGHSASFDPGAEITAVPTAVRVAEIAAAVRLPVIAGGGIAGPADVRAVLSAGASAAVIGTLLLRCDESGASVTHQRALVDPSFSETVITRAFTGRPARGLLNGFIRRHEADAPLGYPAIHHLSAGIRRAAAAAGDADRVHLWAGTGHAAARTGPAAGILSSLL